MDRRTCIALLITASAGWPLAGRAQRPAMPVVGFLGSASADEDTDSLRGLVQGLSEAGYIEGRNLSLEFRWAEGRYERLSALAAELAERRVAVILCAALPAAVAAKQATSSIPIVFVMGADPVKLGLVASLARPGGNITGVTQLFGELGGKRLQLLHDMVPAATTIGLLINPRHPNAQSQQAEVQAAAQTMGKRIEVLPASNTAEIDAAFASLARLGVGAMLVIADSIFRVHRKQVITLAARHAVPTMYFARDFVSDGGLVSYGGNVREAMRLAAAMPAASSTARSPATCRSCGRPASSW